MATFDENGNYIKTNWQAGDKITATKLNKIEESIEAVNNNDISRHVEADARLDALESGTASDKQAINAKVDALEDVVEANKDATDLEIYSINQHMTLLDKKIDDGVAEVEAIANTVDGKIATAEAEMTAQVNTAKDEMTAQVNQGKADMEAMVAEVEADLEGLHAKDEEFSAQLEHIAIDIRKLGCVCDGVTDDLPNLLNGLNEITPPYNLKFPANTTTVINGYIPLTSNINIIGENSKIKQLKTNSPIFFGTGIENVKFEGLDFIGLETDFVEAGIYTDDAASGIYLRETLTNKNITIKNCTFREIAHASIYLRNVDGFLIKNCYLEGLSGEIITSGVNYQFGIRLLNNIRNGIIENNHINKGSQGIYLDHEIDSIKVTNNTIENITGQHGLYCTDGNNLILANNIVRNIALDGIKIQLDDNNIRNSENTIINGNFFNNISGNGISLTNTGSNSSYRHNSIIISNNQLSGNTGGSGINITTTDNANINNNVVKGFSNGITIGDATNIYIDSNRVSDNQQNGIVNNLVKSSKSECIYISNNIVTNCGLSERAGYDYALSFAYCSNLFIQNNIVDSTDKKQRYCLYIINTEDMSDIYIDNNKFMNAKDYSIRFHVNNTINIFKDNYFINSLNIPTEYLSI